MCSGKSYYTRFHGSAEITRQEIGGQTKMRRWKLTDRKVTDKLARVETDRQENDGQNGRGGNSETNLSVYVTSCFLNASNNQLYRVVKKI